MGGWLQLEGERWDGEEERGKEGEIEEESVSRVGIYWLLPMESPMNMFCQYTHRWFHWWLCHVTIWRFRFESLDHSVNKIIWKKSTLSHHCNFSKKLYNPLAIRSVYTDRITNGYFLLVYTDKSRDKIISVGNNYWWKIMSVILLVFIDFLAVDAERVVSIFL